MPYKILLANNDSRVAASLVEYLEGDDLHILKASDAESVLRIVLEENLHIVILDLEMQGFNGLSLFEYVSKVRPNATYILIAPHGNLPSALETMKKGIFGYIEKPFSLQKIRQTLHAALEYHRAISENAALKNSLTDLQERCGELTAILKESIKLRALTEFTSDLGEEDSVEDVLKKLLRATLETTGSRKGSIFLYSLKGYGINLKMVDSLLGPTLHNADQKQMIPALTLFKRDKNQAQAFQFEQDIPCKMESFQEDFSSSQSCLTVSIEDTHTLWGVLYLDEKVSGENYCSEDFMNVSLLTKKAVARLNQLEFKGQRSFFTKDYVKLRKEYARLQLHRASLERSLPVLTVVIDQNLRILDACKKYRELFSGGDRATSDYLFDEALWLHFEGDIRQQITDALKRNEAFASDKLNYIETPNYPRLFKIRVLPQPNGATVAPGGKYLLILEDVTEYERITRRLLTLENLIVMGKFLANIAHDLNNPLDGLNRLVKILEKKVDNNVESEFFEMMYAAIKRMGNSVRSFLQCTKEAMDKSTASPLSQLLDEALYIMSPKLADKNIQIRKNYSGSNMHKDFPTNFYNVFINLIKNAYDATDVDGILEIRICDNQDPARVDISFADNGPGIPHEIMPDVTKPFFTTKEDGNGLGLSLCKKIIADFGGNLRIKNRSPHGCEVVLSLVVQCLLLIFSYAEGLLLPLVQ